MKYLFVKSLVLFFILGFFCGCSNNVKINDEKINYKEEMLKEGTPVSPGYTYATKDGTFARELETAIQEIAGERVEVYYEDDAQKLYRLFVTQDSVNLHMTMKEGRTNKLSQRFAAPEGLNLHISFRVDPTKSNNEREIEFSKDIKRTMAILAEHLKKPKKKNVCVQFMGVVDVPSRHPTDENPYITVIIASIMTDAVKKTDWSSVKPEEIPDICRRDGGFFENAMFDD